jgi:Ca2+-transporting ATPase
MSKYLNREEKEVTKALNHNPMGLSEDEVNKRLDRYGYNELKEKRKVTPLKILSRQFANFLVWILFAAAGISAYIGETINFWVILFIVAFIVILGFIQEYKAERAMEALKKIVQPTTSVMRDGKVRKVLTKEIVPGDILLLETGDKVPADATILNIIGLRIDEAALTGESIPVEKSKGEIIFAGTQIVHGKCKAVVIATGMQTKLGKIAEMIQEEEEKTPLQIKIAQLGKTLALIALAACTIIFVTGTFKGAPMAEMLIVTLALAVAAVPEGLPLTLTITLSIGMHRMAKHNAIIRKMLAVETLGSTTVICTDKTGTLTKNEMTAEKVFVNDSVIKVSGVGYEPKGGFFINGERINPQGDETLTLLLKACALCNNSFLEEKEGKWEIIGNPTEASLVVLAAKGGQWKDDLEEQYERIEEIIFTSERKLMSAVHQKGEEKIAFAKGAPEVVLERCKYIMRDGSIGELSEREVENIIKVNNDFAAKALRVLGVAYKDISGKVTLGNVEEELVFLGLVGMIDPPRKEVKEAVDTCRNAGIRVMMITGDNPETAKAIGKEIGLMEKHDSKVLTGKELDNMSDKKLTKIVEDVAIYARTHPEHKLRIVNALKQKGHIVAMTGDGVNDAPAIKKADVGIAMGIKGTDVTREASDMVLQDDNFATIVEAVKGGRTIYENIEKFTCYLISRNFTEVILISLGITLLGFEFLPLLALQILFINVIGEEFPAIALGMDPPRKGIMLKPPRKPKQRILTRRNSFLVFSMATFMALTAFLIFIFANPSVNITYARTMTFATIVIMVIVNTFNFRSLDESIINIGFHTNRGIMLAITIIAIVTGIVMYVPFLQKVFVLTTLGPVDWVICITAAFATFVFMEVIKLVKSIRTSKSIGA